jgi:MFS transporter, DHA1 family, tetracycline resistance protein
MKKINLNIWPLFLTVLIDFIGVGIILPLLAPMLEDPSNGLISREIPEFYRHLIYGVMVAAYPFFQFIGAPILGTLSDQLGRKKVLLLSMSGTVLGYAITGFGVVTGNLYMIFFGRALDGITGGNFAIANSAIADISDKEDRPKNYGLLGVAFGIGFILGPIMGGLLSDSSIHPLFSIGTPFFIASTITLLNVVFIYFFFQETLQIFRKSKVNLLAGFSNIRRAFKHSQLEELFVVVFLFAIGFTLFTQVFTLYLIEIFNFSQREIGYFYGASGIGMIMVQGLLVPFVSKIFKSITLVRVGLIGLAITLIIFLFIQVPIYLYLFTIFVAIFNGIARPNLTTIIANETTDDMHGEVQGIVQSITSVGMASAPIIGGMIFGLNPNFPNILAAGFLIIGYLVLIRKK